MQVPSFFAPVLAETENDSVSGRLLGKRGLVFALAVAVLLTATGAAAAVSRDQRAGDSATSPSAEASVDPSGAAAAAADPGAPSGNPAAPTVPVSGPAYRLASTDGGVSTHGWFDSAASGGSAAGATSSAIVGLAQHEDGEGYWLAAADGGVFAFGNAQFFGSAAGASTAPMTDIAPSPTDNGYLLAATDGGVFAFGDAQFQGAAIGEGLNSKIVSISETPSGAGYWLAAADGGVFAFGDAPFLGTLADRSVNARIVDLVPSGSGQGYYLVAADGGVFAFGDAPFFGAASSEKLTKPIVGMTLTPEGSGYWLLSADGGVFAYGDAPFLGAPSSSGGKGNFIAIAGGLGRHQPPAAPPAVEAEAPAPAPASPAPVSAAADAPAAASPAPAAEPAVSSKTSKARTPKVAPKPKPERQLDGQFGWDISYPQCGGSFPPGPMAYTIIGVNGGRAFKYNKCLGEQWRWARSQGPAGIYVNIHFPRGEAELAAGATSDRQPDCNGAIGCVAYNFGVNGIRDSIAYARAQGVDAPFVWLDVEHLNYWAPQPELNAIVIRGAIDAAREAGMGVGIYSTPFQYRKLTGDEQAQVPVWSAGAPGIEAVAEYCATRGFGGGPVAIVQMRPGQYDPNVACPGAGAMSRYFAMP